MIGHRRSLNERDGQLRRHPDGDLCQVVFTLLSYHTLYAYITIPCTEHPTIGLVVRCTYIPSRLKTGVVDPIHVRRLERRPKVKSIVHKRFCRVIGCPATATPTATATSSSTALLPSVLYIQSLSHLHLAYTVQYPTMSWFSSSKESTGPAKPNFHPVTSSLTGYGPLAPKDTAVSPPLLFRTPYNVTEYFDRRRIRQWLTVYCMSVGEADNLPSGHAAPTEVSKPRPKFGTRSWKMAVS